MSEPREIRVSHAERDQYVNRLNEAFAEGRLDVEEFSERVDQANQAKVRSELEVLVRDLPAPGTHLVSGTSAVPAPVAEYGAVQRIEPGGPPQELHISPIGGLSRKGRWRMRPKTTVVTLIGGVDLDLTEATFAQQVVELRSYNVIGGVSLKVPPGVRVETSGFNLLGGTDNRTDWSDDPTAPVVRVTSFSLIGGLSAKTKRPQA